MLHHWFPLGKFLQYCVLPLPNRKVILHPSHLLISPFSFSILLQIAYPLCFLQLILQILHPPPQSHHFRAIVVQPCGSIDGNRGIIGHAGFLEDFLSFGILIQSHHLEKMEKTNKWTKILIVLIQNTIILVQTSQRAYNVCFMGLYSCTMCAHACVCVCVSAS